MPRESALARYPSPFEVVDNAVTNLGASTLRPQAQPHQETPEGGKRRPMREWATVPVDRSDAEEHPAREALQFVSAHPERR